MITAFTAAAPAPSSPPRGPSAVVGSGLLGLGLAVSILLHLGLAGVIAVGGDFGSRRAAPPERVIDLVSIEEFLPPPIVSEAPPEPESPAAPPPAAETPQEPLPRNDLPSMPEDAGADGSATAMTLPVSPPVPSPRAGDAGGGEDTDYLPQFKISDVPVVPAHEVLSRIVYPPLAAKQGVEAVVYLELFIDRTGKISKITVLKDPGFGFAEAALNALAGLVCEPAKIDGRAVAVRFRYPVRFKLR